MIYDLAIVGGGIAGYSAALTANRLLLNTLWLGEAGFGDKLSHAETVTNFPGVMGNGAQFARRLAEQMEREGISLTPLRVDGVYFSDGLYTLTAGKQSFTARTVILATGVETRGKVEGEREFLGRGVSYCAVCDGALYRGKRVAAVMTSAKFLEEVRYLADFAAEVLLFTLEAVPPAERVTVVPELPVAVEGTSRVERIRTQNGVYKTDGVFFLRDAMPPEALAFGIRTKDGHVEVTRDLATNLPGLFAAGDITGRPYQYIKAAGEGNVAAYSARNYLLQRKS